LSEPDFLTVTRTAYDTVAASYADLVADNLDVNPFDRAVLGLYAELVHAANREPGKPRVTEVGCGPGRIAAHLAGLGLDARGIDLSPGMIEQARSRHPALEFAVGSMTALDPHLPGHQLDGLVAWYSLIHIPPAERPAVYASFRRVLAPGGHLLLAFHSGDERRHITEAYGHSGLDLDSYRLLPDRVEAGLAEAGFTSVARLTRAPIGAEKTAQAYLLVRAT